MKQKFDEAVKEGKQFPYEEELLDMLEQLVRDADRKIAQSRERLDRDQKFDAEVKAKARKVEEVSDEMAKALARAEQLGEEGKVEDSLKLMGRVEELKRLRSQAEAEYHEMLPPGADRQQKLRACDDCGLFLSLSDNDR